MMYCTIIWMYTYVYIYIYVLCIYRYIYRERDLFYMFICLKGAAAVPGAGGRAAPRGHRREAAERNNICPQ